MDTQKLEAKLDEAEIKQTRRKVETIRFKEDSINKVRKENYTFANCRKNNRR